MNSSPDVPFRLQVMYLLGLSVTLVAAGALLGETLFAFIASLIGISVGVGAAVWIVIGVVILFISIASIQEVSE